jgi:hypothetical protein
MNKMWEVIEKEARDGSEKKHGDYRMGMRSGMRGGYKMGRRDDDVNEAYECGFEDGYSEAMRKIFNIIKNAD